MKKYENPTVSTIEFETKDVITVSGLILVARPPQADSMTVTYDSLWENE